MEKAAKNKPGWRHIVQSVLSSFIGVQSKKRADIDFQQGDFKVYVGVGIVLVIVFVLGVVGVVKFVV